MKNIHTQESGRSMIEMLGVLAIIGVLSVGGIAGYSQAMSRFKVTKTTDQIQQMVTNIRTLFGSQRTYQGISNYSTMYSVGVLTEDNCPDTTATGSCSNPINPYGGKITLGAVKDDHARANRGFYIAYDSLPSDACVRLSIQDWGDSSSGLVAVKASSTASAPGDQVPTTSSTSAPTIALSRNSETPMQITTATTGCGVKRQPESSIILYFR